jgi:RHS repeat-associated protein
LNWTAPTCTNKVDVRRATVKDFTDVTTIASGVSAASYTDVGEGAVLSNKFYLVFGPQPSLHFHVNDHLGSTRLVIDQDKKIEGMYENFPFGGVKSETCSQLSGGFHGKERDEATGIEDYGLRHYSAKLDRFLTPDPTKQAIDFGHPVSWNAYIFNLNNPTTFVDPDGAAGKAWVDQYVAFRVGMMPVVGDAYDLGSAIIGVDLITGEQLTLRGQLLTGAAVILPFVAGRSLRSSKDAVEEVAENRTIRRAFAEGIENAASRGGRSAIEAADKATAGPIHHLMTNKNWVSTLRGGPWSPRFRDIAGKAGMTLEDVANKVAVPGHVGPHPEAYHQAVFDRLTTATRGLSGNAYGAAFRAELGAIKSEAATVGSHLNKLLSGG